MVINKRLDPVRLPDFCPTCLPSDSEALTPQNYYF